MKNESEETLNTQQAAERLGVSQRSIALWVGLGYFPNAYRNGPKKRSPFRIPLSDIESLEEQRKLQQVH